MTSEHPQRCETCNNTYEDDLKGFTYCKKTHLVLFIRDENNKIIDRGVSVMITRVVGCASHNSIPPESGPKGHIQTEV